MCPAIIRERLQKVLSSWCKAIDQISGLQADATVILIRRDNHAVTGAEFQGPVVDREFVRSFFGRMWTEHGDVYADGLRHRFRM